MSALAHMIEDLGVATVVLGLVRPHLEAIRPPRALFLPFPLGRPLGEPGDAAFQLGVLRHALGLLERTDGPVILEDFSPDAPSQTPLAGWSPGFSLPDAEASPAALAAEIALVRPHWERARTRFGRTTVGITMLAPEAWPAALAPYLDGVTESPVPGMTPALALRYLCDDLKAFYSEAAQAAGPMPGIGQIEQWMWSATVAGRVLLALRRVALASADNGLRTIAPRFIVPTPFLPADEPR